MTLEEVLQQYRINYAGHPRYNRRTAPLRGLIDSLKELLADCTGSAPEIEGAARENLERYERELEAIEGAQALSPAHRKLWAFRERLTLYADRYQRHFAEQARSTRNRELLIEMSMDLAFWSAEFKRHLEHDSLAAERPQAESWLEEAQNRKKLYEGELKKIGAAQRSGAASEQGMLIAQLANQCFHLYRGQFAGRPRSSRRLSSLERLLQRLERLEERLTSLLRGGLSGEPHEANLKVIQGARARYQSELTTLRAAQKSLELEGLIEGLREELAHVMGLYREQFAGQSRADRDLDALSLLCDRLFDSCALLWPLADQGIDAADWLARDCTDQLRFLHAEFGAIRAAQREQSESQH